MDWLHDKDTLEFIFGLIGAVAAIFGILWAIFTYRKRKNEQRSFLQENKTNISNANIENVESNKTQTRIGDSGYVIGTIKGNNVQIGNKNTQNIEDT